jgi:protein involved in polysaccharide export with SLBB domain
VVDVGGFVGQPGTVEIPPEGLTLQQALIRARGVSLQSLGFSATPALLESMLVRLQRGREVWSFPLPLVQNDVAGLIQVAPGDLLEVVQVNATSLGIKLQDDERFTGTVEISGDHPFVGTSEMEVLKQEMKVEGSNSLAVPQLLKLQSLQKQGFNSAANVVVLTRVSPRNGALIEHYVLPADSYGAADVAEQGSAVLPNDSFHFTVLPRLPVIQAGIIAPRIKQLLDAGVPPEECHRRIREALGANP